MSWREYKENLLKWSLDCEERLKELNLSLSKRRLRGDLVEVFEIFRNLNNININDYVTTDLSSITCNNGLKIIVKRFRSNEAKRFFFFL